MPNTCLIAIDGSEPSLKSIEYIIADAATRAAIPRVYLVNVQPSLPSDITRFVDKATVEDFQREAGDTALAAARTRLDQASLAYSAHVLVGEAAPTLVEFANANHCDMIIMGAHGFGTVIGLFMGSVTVKVVQLSAIPVLLIK
ncbi:MAG: universal stress protein [Rhodoferax sp.]|uniref:universal stress protein n=1 Tax=Rhodoferax sp. TaxID=50421 RepID=UPI001B59991A|nr:universal stress protein [Rhodoferax sp.]MBP9904991.1 universal stress protein [Rhodoferax sp.]